MRNERIGLVALAAVLLAALAGCNTVEGVGLDVASGARTVGGWFGGRGY